MLFKIVVAATIVEAIVETLKMIWDRNKISISKILAIIVGIIIAIVCEVDILSAVGLPVILPILGYILTGILISRGANFVSDFVRVIREMGE
jgi:hypothetical protein